MKPIMQLIGCTSTQIHAWIATTNYPPRRSSKPASTTLSLDQSIRRVTRGSENSRQVHTQDIKPSRRVSTRLASNTQKNTSSITHARKSKATQISLGVGRPRATGGSGARAVTRTSVSSSRLKDSKRGKRQIAESDIVEEEEDSDPKSVYFLKVHLRWSSNTF